MRENNLLASVALFSQLYNNENYRDITNIIAEFIKSAIAAEGKLTFTVSEITKLLEKHYEFRIPEAVIKTTIRSRLNKVARSFHGAYSFTLEVKDEYKKIFDGYQAIKLSQQLIINSLIAYIEERQNCPASEEEKEVIIDNFKRYLLDGSTADKYSKLISGFVIKNQLVNGFCANLNLIKEGILLYQGIRFTADINERGKWKNELKIFLTTEHLFNALGFNGTLFKAIFDDFLDLVKEINQESKGKYGGNLIELKYLDETQQEVNIFFETAEAIIKGRVQLDYSKPAMIEIIEGCETPSDVRSKKIKFKHDLEKLGIEFQHFPHSIYSYTDFVVEDENMLEEIRKESQERGRLFDEHMCREVFRIFTKINYYRGGTSKSKFENIGCILITGNRFALHLAHHFKVKFEGDDIPFAKDIEYITSKFWFKLKKGFSEKSNFPKSFDVIAKAQVVLATQLSHTIHQQYEKLKNDFKLGDLTKELALELNYELRQKSIKPEDITLENIDASLDFLSSENYFEQVFSERLKKEEELANAKQLSENLQQEINRRDKIEMKRLLSIQHNEFEKRKNKFTREQWDLLEKTFSRDLRYFLKIIFLNFAIASFAAGISVSISLKKWLNLSDKWAISVFYIYVILVVTEILGRSYLFNKERVKNGFLRVTLLLGFKNYEKYKQDKIIFFKSQYGSENLKMPTDQG